MMKQQLSPILEENESPEPKTTVRKMMRQMQLKTPAKVNLSIKKSKQSISSSNLLGLIGISPLVEELQRLKL
jgi:hypothetical protein